MNKRQRKKRLKNITRRYFVGIDLLRFSDCSVISTKTTEEIYRSFNVPVEYINKSAKETQLAYEELLKTFGIVIKEGCD